MKKHLSRSTSFENVHKPSRFELREFLNNVSSYTRSGLPHPRVMLNKRGNPISLKEFFLKNSEETSKKGRKPNLKETIYFVELDPVRHSRADRSKLKELKREIKKKMMMKGEIFNKWETILKMTT